MKTYSKIGVMEFRIQKSKKVIVAFALLGICLLQLSSCQKHKAVPHPKHKAVAVIKDTIGAEKIMESTLEFSGVLELPLSETISDISFSDPFRDIILRQIHITEMDTIYYKAEEIPYLNNRTVVLVIKANKAAVEKDRNEGFNPCDVKTIRYVLLAETQTGKVISCSSKICDDFDNENGPRIDFDFSSFHLGSDSKQAFGIINFEEGSTSISNYRAYDIELYLSEQNSISFLLSSTLHKENESKCWWNEPEFYSYSSTNSKIYLGRKITEGFRDLIFKFEFETCHYVEKNKMKSQKRILTEDDIEDYLPVVEKDTAVNIYRYHKKYKRYLPVKLNDSAKLRYNI